MELRILGAHNCETRDARLTSLLLDRVIEIDAGGLTSSLTFDEQEQIKAVLITHHHFDHIRDLATLGMNRYSSGPVAVYALESVLDIISRYLLDGTLYPDFRARPSPEKPSLRLCPIEPHQEVTIEGYTVLPLPVNHRIPTVGYHVTAPDNKSLFYTGDTGRNDASLWQDLSADLLITEVTVPNKYHDVAEETGHLTPQSLKQELTNLQKARGSLPPVVIVHMSPHIEDDIRREIAQVAAELGADITPAYEGMRIVV
jgi:ribonuclease BN (tRNA processing enzyme)